MKSGRIFFLACLLLLSSTYGIVFAQAEKPNQKDLNRKQLLNRRQLRLDVGDPDTFQDNVKFLGLVSSGIVFLQEGCEPDEPGSDDRCVNLNPAPAETEFDVRDIGRVTLPGNSARSLIYPITTSTIVYEIENTTGSPQPSAGISYTPYLTIESTALNDPRAVGDDGLPLNGRLDYVLLGGDRFVDRSLAVGERDFQYQSYTRTLLVGLAKSVFSGGYQIPADIVDRMFRRPMTIHLNLRGSARLISENSATRLNYHMRLMGN